MIETNGFNDGTHGDSRPSNPGLPPTDLRVMDDVACQGLHCVFSLTPRLCFTVATRKRTIAADSLRSNAVPLYKRFSWLSLGHIVCNNEQSSYSAYGSSIRLSRNLITDIFLLRIEGLHVSYSTREGTV